MMVILNQRTTPLGGHPYMVQINNSGWCTHIRCYTIQQLIMKQTAGVLIGTVIGFNLKWTLVLKFKIIH